MTDRRPLLRAIYDAAVAAAHPDVVLAPHLRPVPKGRVICLAAGKGAGAMAAAAERHYLDMLELAPERLVGNVQTKWMKLFHRTPRIRFPRILASAAPARGNTV